MGFGTRLSTLKPGGKLRNPEGFAIFRSRENRDFKGGLRLLRDSCQIIQDFLFLVLREPFEQRKDFLGELSMGQTFMRLNIACVNQSTADVAVDGLRHEGPQGEGLWPGFNVT